MLLSLLYSGSSSVCTIVLVFLSTAHASFDMSGSTSMLTFTLLLPSCTESTHSSRARFLGWLALESVGFSSRQKFSLFCGNTGEVMYTFAGDKKAGAGDQC